MSQVLHSLTDIRCQNLTSTKIVVLFRWYRSPYENNSFFFGELKYYDRSRMNNLMRNSKLLLTCQGQRISGLILSRFYAKPVIAAGGKHNVMHAGNCHMVTVPPTNKLMFFSSFQLISSARESQENWKGRSDC